MQQQQSTHSIADNSEVYTSDLLEFFHDNKLGQFDVYVPNVVLLALDGHLATQQSELIYYTCLVYSGILVACTSERIS